jgi:hypothetical protein
MRTRIVPVHLAAALAALAFAGPAAAAPLSHLRPGVRSARLDERVPVNVVFVGFDRGEVGDSEFLGGLPQRYRPIVRSRAPYGKVEELGIDYTYDYNIVHTSAAWEDTFFTALKGLAAPAPRTSYQDTYNAQAGTRDVGQNHFIDAPTVEKWLIDNAPPGVDTRRDTIFFVNWWGRSDFIDHVYTKFGEPDPDTGFDFGVNQDSRKLVAWGGTTPDDEETGLGARGVRRVWFYDLSAGPEVWGGSYDVTRTDIDGDGAPDYRLPAAWEYADGGYRSPAALTGDLSKVTRYAAINLMFTTSPLFPPYLTPELLPAKLDLDRNTYEGWPGVDASATYQSPAYLLQEESELFPAMPMSADTQDLPFQGKAQQCYLLWLVDAACFHSRPQYPAAADLFLHNALNLEQALDQDVGTHDEADDDPGGDRGGGGAKRVDRLYEAPAFNYATDDASAAPFLGYTDDNWLDGTQSFVYGFISPGVVKRGYGLTTTQIHEYGHYFGMSHPHDGFDSETGIDYTATGPLFFAWATDEQNSMMSYIDLNWDFSQFDRDNAARQQAAGYLINANVVAGRILAGGHAKRAGAELAAADADAGRARSAMAAHDYRATWLDARAAYERVLRAAAKAGVKIEPSYNGWMVLPKEHPKDPARNPVVAYAGFDRIGAGTHRSLP